MNANALNDINSGDIDALRAMGAHVDIDVAGNPLSVSWGLHAAITDDGLQILEKMSSLTALELHGTMTDGRLKHIAPLFNLTSFFLGRRYLHVSPNTFTDVGLQYLSRLNNLHTLSLHSIGRVSEVGLAHLKELSYLRLLDLELLPITLDSLRQLQGLNLTHLEVPNTIGLNYVPLFPLLEIVYAFDIPDDELKLLSSLKYLKELGIMSHQVTDDAIEYLLPLITLDKLYLFETQISENGFVRLRSGLPNCEIES
jgi:F-box and leucine-rich repeat protein 14